MPPIGTCFRFYTQMRVQKKKLLPIKLKTVYTTVYGVEKFMVEKSGVEKSGVGKFMVKKSGVERSGVEVWG